MTLSFGQWLQLGFGAMKLVGRHPELISDAIAFREKHKGAVDDAIALWRSVVPPDAAPPKDVMTHTEVIEKIRTGGMTPAEQAQFDRASQLGG